VDAGRGAEVGPERQLAVRARRHEVIGPVPAEDGGVEAGHVGPALVFEGNRRHGDVDVVGQQGDQGVDIAGDAYGH
jgi:hypothetical protein